MVAEEHAGGNPVRDAIHDALETRRARLRREIRAYPTPIAGCDVQFNGLLEERTALGREIGRLDEAFAAGQEDGARAAAAFLASSRFLDAEATRRIAALLKKRPGAESP